MQLIKYDKNEGLLTIEISIDGTPTWYYYYQEDQKHENDNSTGRSKSHTLGMPGELIRKAHIWEFRLANVSDVAIDVELQIEWFQEKGSNRTKTQIHKWNTISPIAPNSGSLQGESGLLIS